MEEIKNKILEFFAGIDLDESTHTYTLSGKKIFKISVSGLISPYKHKTDWETVKHNVAVSKGITPEKVQESWDEAAKLGCDIGDKTHIFGENYVLNGFKGEPTTGYERAVVKFWSEIPPHIVPLSLEIKMYHKELLFAGTSDILLYNTKTKEIYIADYKTNKDLFKNFAGNTMTAPFSNYLCQPYRHYTLQLSYYQILLEQIPGIKVSRRMLIWILPDGNYKMYDTEDVTGILKEELKLHGINGKA